MVFSVLDGLEMVNCDGARGIGVFFCWFCCCFVLVLFCSRHLFCLVVHSAAKRWLFIQKKAYMHWKEKRKIWAGMSLSAAMMIEII